MRITATISIPKTLFKEIKKISKEEETTRSELIRQALREYLIRKKCERARNKLMLEAARKVVIMTEKEIFDEIS
ncbi:MAG: ribbon-helix-helix domain-containing protein [Endomicrobia bacterium]|nr:ribbon-helix-helix domain-containing protein [Endomicrobiia bacterium]